MKEQTVLVTAGRYPERFDGAVNTPIYRGSTIVHESMAHWEEKKKRRAAGDPAASTYGRFGMATQHALQEAIAELEGGYRSFLFPSGLAAISSTLLTLLSAGDHILITDSAYSPTTGFIKRVLQRFGVSYDVYHPEAGNSLESQLRPETKVVYVESPGSETFEIQDIPAIAEVAHRHGAKVVMDNTWGTPLFYKPFEHGVDVSIQAATKYIVGHSDAMLGIVTCTEELWPQFKATVEDLGQTAGPDEAFLALRGLRTLGVRLQQHWRNGIEVASWLEQRPEVERVLHPGLPSHPGHELWKRDFRGACGLFAMVLKPAPEEAVHAFVDALQYFGLGVSWGGYESLIIPFDPKGSRSAYKWPYEGQAMRLHIGLEDPADLIADLEQALGHLNSTKTKLSA